MAIAVAPGSVVSIALDAGNQVFIKGTGIYRVSMINGSSAPAADNSISTGGSFVGPYQSSASITVLAYGPCEYEEYAAQNPTTTRPQYFLGTFASSSALSTVHPPATAIGADALVSGVKYYSDGSSWIALEAGSTGSWSSLSDKATADLPADNAPLASALSAKQATLVSGSNIKTINGNSLLGSGDLVISGGGGSSYPEVLNFAALPGSPSEGDTYVVLQAQGVYFINRKPAGLYRYTSGAWVYLGEVPDGYFTDNVLRFFDNGDPTKQLAFELNGISTGTTRTLTVPDASGTIALTSDARFTDEREWTAATISQAEAEAGTATTRRAFTAQRVFQAIAAWWAALTVGPSKITMSTARLLGRSTAGSGAAEEIAIGSGLSLSAGTLSATVAGGAYEVADWTALQALTGVPDGRVYVVQAPVVTGGNRGTQWVRDGSVWRPAAAQALYTLRTPVAGTAGGSASQSLIALQIPGGLLPACGRIRFSARLTYSAADSGLRNVRFFIASSSTLPGTGNELLLAANLAANLRQLSVGRSYQCASNTTLKFVDGGGFGISSEYGTASSTATVDGTDTPQANMASTVFLHVGSYQAAGFSATVTLDQFTLLVE